VDIKLFQSFVIGCEQRMSSIRKHGRYWLIGVFFALSLADLYLTWQLFETEGASARETNPLANWVLAEFGWDGLAYFKLGTVIFVGLVTAVVYSFRPRTGVRLLTGNCAILGAVVVYSTALLCFPGIVSAESAALEDVIAARSRAIDEALGRSKERLANKVDLAQKMLRRQISLADAVERILAVEEDGSIRLQTLRENHPDLSERQCVAINFMEYTLVQVRHDREKVQQLKLELASLYESTFGTPVPARWWTVDEGIFQLADARPQSHPRGRGFFHHGGQRKVRPHWGRAG
jgi:hypothetical protein